jgi:hypothetical protein
LWGGGVVAPYETGCFYPEFNKLLKKIFVKSEFKLAETLSIQNKSIG